MSKKMQVREEVIYSIVPVTQNSKPSKTKQHIDYGYQNHF